MDLYLIFFRHFVNGASLGSGILVSTTYCVWEYNCSLLWAISDDEILRRCTVNCWPSEKVYWAVATPFKAIDRFRRRKNARGAVSVGGLEINFLALCEFSITYSMVVISKRVAISLLPPISQYPNPSSSGDNIAQDTS